MRVSVCRRVISCSVDMTVSLCFTRAVWPPRYLQVTAELETILKERDGGTYWVMKGTSLQGFPPASSNVALCPSAGMSGVSCDGSWWETALLGFPHQNAAPIRGTVSGLLFFLGGVGWVGGG